jgi:hypothetical protein
MTMARENKSGGRRGDQFNDVVEKPSRVGDGRLPTETQFKPGISGNKKAPRFSEVIEQVLDEKIELRVGNRVRRQRESTEPNAQLHSTLHLEHQS